MRDLPSASGTTDEDFGASTFTPHARAQRVETTDLPKAKRLQKPAKAAETDLWGDALRVKPALSWRMVTLGPQSHHTMRELVEETKVLAASGTRGVPPSVEEGPIRRWIGRYELLQRLARGGMATVFLGRATGSAGFEKRVAIKVIHPFLADDPELIEMFLDEGRIASQIHSPHVVAILDLGEDRGDYYIVMELVEGTTLSALLRALRGAGARLPLPLILQILADACEGLRAAHELRDPAGNLYGLIHRDVTPQNLMIDRDGWVKLADFGIMKAKGRRSHTREGQLRGKLPYMSPEQAQALPLAPSSDIFALGVILWELCTGERLFGADREAEILARVIACRRPPLAELRPDLPPEIEALLANTLTKEPGDRFPSAEAMLVELRRLLRRFAGEEEPRGALAALIRGHFGAQEKYRHAATQASAPGGSTPAVAAASEEQTRPELVVHDTMRDADGAPRPGQTGPALVTPSGRPGGAAAVGDETKPDALAAASAPGGAPSAGSVLSRASDELTTPGGGLAALSGSSARLATRAAEPSPLEREDERARRRRRRRPWALWLGLPLVGAIVGVTALIAVGELQGATRGEEPRRPSQLATAAEAPRPEVVAAPVVDEVRWTLNTEPPGASVAILGLPPELQAEVERRLAGAVTPVEVMLPRSDERALTLVLRLDGHEERSEVLLPLASENLYRPLRPLPSTSPPETEAPTRRPPRLTNRATRPAKEPLGALDLREPTFESPPRRKPHEGE